MWVDDAMLETMNNLDNYIDSIHYNEQVSSDILKRIKKNQGLISYSNYQEKVNDLFQYIENFDYQKKCGIEEIKILIKYEICSLSSTPSAVA